VVHGDVENRGADKVQSCCGKTARNIRERTIMRTDKSNGAQEAKNRFRTDRLRMVEQQIRGRGIKDPHVLKAMEEVPRHLFVAPDDQSSAYDDNPLPIGYGQTISQPYIVALMTETLHITAHDRVLEIGTGSGYQSAILSRLAKDVFSIESIAPLADRARLTLNDLACHNVHVRVSDGYEGWPDKAPFDGVIVTAAPETVPDELIEQVADGGRIVIPVGLHYQELILLTKERTVVRSHKIADVRFVPMVRKEKG